MENHVENVGIVGIVLACWSLHRNDERQSEWHLAGQSNQGNPAEKCANDLMPTNSSGENDLQDFARFAREALPTIQPTIRSMLCCTS